MLPSWLGNSPHYGPKPEWQGEPSTVYNYQPYANQRPPNDFTRNCVNPAEEYINYNGPNQGDNNYANQSNFSAEFSSYNAGSSQGRSAYKNVGNRGLPFRRELELKSDFSRPNPNKVVTNWNVDNRNWFRRRNPTNFKHGQTWRPYRRRSYDVDLNDVMYGVQFFQEGYVPIGGGRFVPRDRDKKYKNKSSATEKMIVTDSELKDFESPIASILNEMLDKIEAEQNIIVDMNELSTFSSDDNSSDIEITEVINVEDTNRLQDSKHYTTIEDFYSNGKLFEKFEDKSFLEMYESGQEVSVLNMASNVEKMETSGLSIEKENIVVNDDLAINMSQKLSPPKKQKIEKLLSKDDNLEKSCKKAKIDSKKSGTKDTSELLEKQQKNTQKRESAVNSDLANGDGYLRNVKEIGTKSGTSELSHKKCTQEKRKSEEGPIQVTHDLSKFHNSEDSHKNVKNLGTNYSKLLKSRRQNTPERKKSGERPVQVTRDLSKFHNSEDSCKNVKKTDLKNGTSELVESRKNSTPEERKSGERPVQVTRDLSKFHNSEDSSKIIKKTDVKNGTSELVESRKNSTPEERKSGERSVQVTRDLSKFHNSEDSSKIIKKTDVKNSTSELLKSRKNSTPERKKSGERPVQVTRDLSKFHNSQDSSKNIKKTDVKNGTSELLESRKNNTPERRKSGERPVQVTRDLSKFHNSEDSCKNIKKTDVKNGTSELLESRKNSTPKRRRSGERLVQVTRDLSKFHNSEDSSKNIKKMDVKNGTSELLESRKNSTPKQRRSGERPVQVTRDLSKFHNSEDSSKNIKKTDVKNGTSELLVSRKNSTPKRRRSAERPVQVTRDLSKFHNSENSCKNIQKMDVKNGTSELLESRKNSTSERRKSAESPVQVTRDLSKCHNSKDSRTNVKKMDTKIGTSRLLESHRKSTQERKSEERSAQIKSNLDENCREIVSETKTVKINTCEKTIVNQNVSLKINTVSKRQKPDKMTQKEKKHVELFSEVINESTKGRVNRHFSTEIKIDKIYRFVKNRKHLNKYELKKFWKFLKCLNKKTVNEHYGILKDQPYIKLGKAVAQLPLVINDSSSNKKQEIVSFELEEVEEKFPSPSESISEMAELNFVRDGLVTVVRLDGGANKSYAEQLANLNQTEQSNNAFGQMSDSDAIFAQISEQLANLDQIEQPNNAVAQVSKSNAIIVQISEQSANLDQTEQSNNAFGQMSDSNAIFAQISEQLANLDQIEQPNNAVAQVSKSNAIIVQISEQSASLDQTEQSNNAVAQMSDSSAILAQISEILDSTCMQTEEQVPLKTNACSQTEPELIDLTGDDNIKIELDETDSTVSSTTVFRLKVKDPFSLGMFSEEHVKTINVVTKHINRLMIERMCYKMCLDTCINDADYIKRRTLQHRQNLNEILDEIVLELKENMEILGNSNFYQQVSVEITKLKKFKFDPKQSFEQLWRIFKLRPAAFKLARPFFKSASEILQAPFDGDSLEAVNQCHENTAIRLSHQQHSATDQESTTPIQLNGNQYQLTTSQATTQTSYQQLENQHMPDISQNNSMLSTQLNQPATAIMMSHQRHSATDQEIITPSQLRGRQNQLATSQANTQTYQQLNNQHPNVSQDNSMFSAQLNQSVTAIMPSHQRRFVTNQESTTPSQLNINLNQLATSQTRTQTSYHMPNISQNYSISSAQSNQPATAIMMSHQRHSATDQESITPSQLNGNRNQLTTSPARTQKSYQQLNNQHMSQNNSMSSAQLNQPATAIMMSHQRYSATQKSTTASQVNANQNQLATSPTRAQTSYQRLNNQNMPNVSQNNSMASAQLNQLSTAIMMSHQRHSATDQESTTASQVNANQNQLATSQARTQISYQQRNNQHMQNVSQNNSVTSAQSHQSVPLNYMEMMCRVFPPNMNHPPPPYNSQKNNSQNVSMPSSGTFRSIPTHQDVYSRNNSVLPQFSGNANMNHPPAPNNSQNNYSQNLSMSASSTFRSIPTHQDGYNGNNSGLPHFSGNANIPMNVRPPPPTYFPTPLQQLSGLIQQPPSINSNNQNGQTLRQFRPPQRQKGGQKKHPAQKPNRRQGTTDPQQVTIPQNCIPTIVSRYVTAAGQQIGSGLVTNYMAPELGHPQHGPGLQIGYMDPTTNTVPERTHQQDLDSRSVIQNANTMQEQRAPHQVQKTSLTTSVKATTGNVAKKAATKLNTQKRPVETKKKNELSSAVTDPLNTRLLTAKANEIENSVMLSGVYIDSDGHPILESGALKNSDAKFIQEYFESGFMFPKREPESELPTVPSNFVSTTLHPANRNNNYGQTEIHQQPSIEPVRVNSVDSGYLSTDSVLSPSSVFRLCAGCNKPSTIECEQCHVETYCSRECREQCLREFHSQVCCTLKPRKRCLPAE